MSESDVIESSVPRAAAEAPSQATLEPPSTPTSTGAGRAAAPVLFPELRPASSGAAASGLDRIYDLTVPVSVELGRTVLSVQDILELAPGSVVGLDRGSDAPVDLFVHGKCVARGQIVVVDGYYGIRITALSG